MKSLCWSSNLFFIDANKLSRASQSIFSKEYVNEEFKGNLHILYLIDDLEEFLNTANKHKGGARTARKKDSQQSLENIFQETRIKNKKTLKEK